MQKPAYLTQNLNSYIWPSLYVAVLIVIRLCLLWPNSSDLLFWEVGLQPCKIMTDMLAPVEHTDWVLSA